MPSAQDKSFIKAVKGHSRLSQADKERLLFLGEYLADFQKERLEGVLAHLAKSASQEELDLFSMEIQQIYERDLLAGAPEEKVLQKQEKVLEEAQDYIASHE